MSVSTLHKATEETKPGWSAVIARELAQVEQTLENVVNSDIPQAYELSMQLLTAGGKRIRPSLMILSAMAAGECDPQRMTYVAAAAELVHMASLVHDDVIDETHERRGVETANDKWGNKISVLGGDYLLSKSFQLLCAYGTADILRLLSATAVRMTESEILQAGGEGDLACWEANYWRIIRDKTAEFMGICCECGALLCGADADIRNALHEYGVQLGLAFQIVDDILDIAGDHVLTGKETGTDLMHGKYTLPMLLALKADESGSLRELLLRGKLTCDEAQEAVRIAVERGAVGDARLAALDCSELAIKQLSVLPDSQHKDALKTLAGFVVTREL